MKRPLLALTLALAVAGCTDDDDLPPPGGPSVARILLSRPQHFALDPGGGVVRFYASLDRGDHVEYGRVVLDLTAGEMTLEADPDGVLVVGELELEVADASYGVGNPLVPDVHLTDIRIRVAEPAVRLATEWESGGRVGYGGITADWILSWSIDSHGQVYPLGDQRLADLTFWVTAYGDASDLRFDLAGWNGGTVWSWADIIVFEDLYMMGSGSWAPIVD